MESQDMREYFAEFCEKQLGEIASSCVVHKDARKLVLEADDRVYELQRSSIQSDEVGIEIVSSKE